MNDFDELMGDVMSTAERFGHREHVRLTWLAVRRCGTAGAVELISDGIQKTARYAGVPQKYNATVSRAWVELTAYHMAEAPGEDFEELVRRNPGLLDKRLLTRFYSSHALASSAARTGWVEPDVKAFPFTLPQGQGV
jgi:CRP-like cAMP-binding protein